MKKHYWWFERNLFFFIFLESLGNNLLRKKQANTHTHMLYIYTKPDNKITFCCSRSKI